MVWVNIIGAIVITLIIYWFWIAKPKTVRSNATEIDIVVADGVYTPARLEIKAGEQVTLSFTRKDPSPCAEKVIFSGLDITEDLPVNKKKNIEIKIIQPGKYDFSCQMQMYRGTLIVK